MKVRISGFSLPCGCGVAAVGLEPEPSDGLESGSESSDADARLHPGFGKGKWTGTAGTTSYIMEGGKLVPLHHTPRTRL